MAHLGAHTALLIEYKALLNKSWVFLVVPSAICLARHVRCNACWIECMSLFGSMYGLFESVTGLSCGPSTVCWVRSVGSRNARWIEYLALLVDCRALLIELQGSFAVPVQSSERDMSHDAELFWLSAGLFWWNARLFCKSITGLFCGSSTICWRRHVREYRALSERGLYASIIGLYAWIIGLLWQKIDLMW